MESPSQGNDRMRWTVLLILLFQSSALLGREFSGLEARIYPEKETYILGEPIFLNIEVVNKGAGSVFIDDTFEGELKVSGAKPAPPNDWAITCYESFSRGVSSVEVRPGEKKVKKLILLNDLYSLDRPKTYRAYAWFGFRSEHTPAKSLKVSSHFGVRVIQGTEAQLKAVFEPYIRDSAISYSYRNSQQYEVWNNAMAAITTMPPPFLEDFILKLSETDSSRSDYIIRALLHLNTERTRKRIEELAEVPNSSLYAVGALIRMHDSSAATVLMRIGNMNYNPAQSCAISHVGLFGVSAIPYLTAALKNRQTQMDAVRGLGATATREAVPLLIEMLDKSTGALLRNVRESLARLTHFADGGAPINEKPRPNEYRRWREWWALHGATFKIYDGNRWSKAKPLP
jgi:hypothetical protein